MEFKQLDNRCTGRMLKKYNIVELFLEIQILLQGSRSYARDFTSDLNFIREFKRPRINDLTDI
jgi:hypothetical protein